MLGRYAEATPPCEQIASSGSSWVYQSILVAVYAQQGAMAKAAAAKAGALKLKPNLTIARLKTMPRPGSQAYFDLLETHFYAGLRKAGVPEK